MSCRYCSEKAETSCSELFSEGGLPGDDAREKDELWPLLELESLSNGYPSALWWAERDRNGEVAGLLVVKRVVFVASHCWDLWASI
jgi:hypothetical protein